MRDGHWSDEQLNKSWTLLFLYSDSTSYHTSYTLFSIQIRIRLSMPLSLPMTLLMQHIRSFRCIMFTLYALSSAFIPLC